MPVSDSTRQIFLNLGRLVWALLFVPCALVLGSIAFDTQFKNGPNDQYWALVYGLFSWAIIFLAPFVTLLRGKIAFKTAAIVSVMLAVGASCFFSIKEYALSPIGVSAGSALEHALRNLPYSAVIFATGAAICGVLVALGRAVFKPSP